MVVLLPLFENRDTAACGVGVGAGGTGAERRAGVALGGFKREEFGAGLAADFAIGAVGGGTGALGLDEAADPAPAALLSPLSAIAFALSSF